MFQKGGSNIHIIIDILRVMCYLSEYKVTFIWIIAAAINKLMFSVTHTRFPGHSIRLAYNKRKQAGGY